MLILTRRIGEKIMIGENIEILLLAIQGGQARLGILAPKHLSVHREEIFEKLFKPSPSVCPSDGSEEPC